MSTSSEEKRLIDGLFDRLQQAEEKTGDRDQEASEHIQQRVAQQPNAPYYMAQTIIIQEEALKRLNERVEELERTSQPQSSGGFLAGLFGANQQRTNTRASSHGRPLSGSGRFGNQSQPGSGRSSGFLGGALQTAAGVAGGVLLGNMLMDMFSGGDELMDEGMAAAEDAGLDQPFDEGMQDMGGGLDDFGDDEFI